MIKVDDLSLQSFVFCEDVRMEATGKHFIVGAIGSGVQLETLPGRIPVALYFELLVPRPGQHELEIRLAGPGEKFGVFQVVLGTAEADTATTLYTPRLDVLIEEPGEMTISLRRSEGEWVEIAQRQIIQARSVAANAVDEKKTRAQAI